jgi:hypothetical protein
MASYPGCDEAQLEHFPEKACPALDAGWTPVFRRKCDQPKKLERVPFNLIRNALYKRSQYGRETPRQDVIGRLTVWNRSDRALLPE